MLLLFSLCFIHSFKVHRSQIIVIACVKPCIVQFIPTMVSYTVKEYGRCFQGNSYIDKFRIVFYFFIERDVVTMHLN